MIAPAMSACNSPSCRADATLSGRGVALERLDELVGFERLIMNLIKRRNAVVPFKQCRGVADQFCGAGVQLPHRVEDGMVVRVENVLLEFGMARDMDLCDTMVRDVVDVIVRIEIMVLRRDINI